jgi:tryptophan synthase beta chain
MPLLAELERAFHEAVADEDFTREFDRLLRTFAGRPTPLYLAPALSERYGARVYLKREDLLHTGAHKINNAIGQALLARRMGKQHVIAETGAGQHGVATAVACALLGLQATIFMGAEDVERQQPNVRRMKLFGADVVPVGESGRGTLKDAINEALRYWTAHALDTFYLFGSVAGPHPYPLVVRTFQSVIGSEARAQVLDAEGRLPDVVIACVGGGSNAIGLFSAFIEDEKVRLVGVEGGGRGAGAHSASLARGKPGIFQGALSYVLDDENGQIEVAHSVAPGLDYPGVGPEHSYLKKTGRAQYLAVSDEEALEAFEKLARLEGILPALESAHAIAALAKIEIEPGSVVIVNLSGRGDKDLDYVFSLKEEKQAHEERDARTNDHA